MVHFKRHPLDSTDDHIGVLGAVTNNLMSFNANGLPQDSGVSASSFALASHTHLEVDITDLDKYTQLQVNNLLALQDEASELATDTTNFNGLLSVADDTIQKALDTLDNFSPSATSWGSISGTLSDQTDLENRFLSQDELSEMGDVVITGPIAEDEVLAYDSGTSMWINQTASEAGLSVVGHTHVASDITDFDTEVTNNTTVQNLLTDSHVQNTDTSLDFGGSNPVTALEIRNFIDSKAQNLGLAPLDASGIVPSIHLPASILGALNYIGTWDATLNTPTLGSSGFGGVQGDYYVVNVAGTTLIDGVSDWEIGDWITHNGSIWQKIDNTDGVSSVNGQLGAVVLDTDDVAEGSTNLYYTEARVSANVDVAANTLASHTQNTDIALRTDKVVVDASGNTDIVGELSIKVYRQASQPVLTADDRMAIWVDTSDSNKSYLMFREAVANTLLVELG